MMHKRARERSADLALTNQVGDGTTVILTRPYGLEQSDQTDGQSSYPELTAFFYR